MALADERGVRRALFQSGEDFALSFGGRAFRTWNEITVDRALDAASGSFALRIVAPERVAQPGVQQLGGRTLSDQTGLLYSLPFGPQDEVEVKAGGQLAITGRIDAVEATYGTTDGTDLLVAGRDRAADLVDCTAANKPGEWIDVSLRDLARELADPFGVSLTIVGNVGARIPVFRLNEGETAWSAIERACRMRGLLCYSDSLGGLRIEPAAAGGSRPGRIAQGENLKKATLSLNDSARFSIYSVVGQRPGTVHASGAAAILVEGNATDAGVRRFRPLVVLAEGAVSPADAQMRAQWEAIVRATRAHRLVVTVPGWRRPLDSQLWQLNTTVPVRIESLGISTELLIVQTVFRRSKREGTTTEIVLARIDAFRPQPAIDPALEIAPRFGAEEE